MCIENDQPSFCTNLAEWDLDSLQATLKRLLESAPVDVRGGAKGGISWIAPPPSVREGVANSDGGVGEEVCPPKTIEPGGAGATDEESYN